MSPQTCPYCDFPGDGNCSACHGTGKMRDPSGAEVACRRCGGSGDCHKCRGLGEIETGGES